MWYWHGMGPWGWLVMLAFWAGVIVLIVWTVRSTTAKPPAGSDAIRILDEHYARGEIELAEFEERRRVLEERQ